MTFDSRWKNPQGSTPQQLYLWAQDIITELRKGAFLGGVTDAIAGLLANKAGLPQVASGHWLIPEAENKTYAVIGKAAFAFTITEVTTRSTAGTCTVTITINGVALGGSANSVSTSEQSQTHSSANAVAAGDTVAIVVSSNSNCEGITVDIAGTLELAA